MASGRARVGRADLLRVLVAGLPGASRGFIGYLERGEEEQDAPPPVEVRAPGRRAPAVPSTSGPSEATRPAPVAPCRTFAPMRFLVPRWEPYAPPEDASPAPAPRRVGQRVAGVPTKPPLMPWDRVAGTLLDLIGREIDVGVDVPQMVRWLGQGRALDQVPRRVRRRWASRAVVLVDRSRRLMPFWGDQDQLLARLRRAVGHRLELRLLPDGPDGPVLEDGLARPGGLADLASGDPVLVLGDLGFYAGDEVRERWRRLGRRLAHIGAPRSGLAPCPEARWDRALAALWNLRCWDRPGARVPAGEEPRAARRLLAQVSWASRVEPGLLRAVRLLLPPGEADVGTELDAWFGDRVDGAHPSAMGLDPVLARRLRSEVLPGLQARIVAAMRRWREAGRPEIWHLEVVAMASAGVAGISGTEADAAARFVETDLPALLDAFPARRQAYLERVRDRLPAGARLRGAAAEALRALVDRDPAPGGRRRTLALYQHGDRLRWDADAGSLVASVELLGDRAELSRDGRIERLDLARPFAVEPGDGPVLETGCGRLQLVWQPRPRWADVMWRNRSGLWAGLRARDVEVDLLWLPQLRLWIVMRLYWRSEPPTQGDWSDLAAIQAYRRELDVGALKQHRHALLGPTGPLQDRIDVLGREHPALLRTVALALNAVNPRWAMRPTTTVAERSALHALGFADALVRPDVALTAPSWADAVGEDDHGVWADIRIGGARLRLRFNSPGEFIMGAPEDEWGRDSDDRPQRRVAFTRGFWLGETPVTQEQWQAVMGSNPSRFKGARRPVEQVSWEDTRRFLERVDQLRPDLGLRLPGEAEWEYACRAGASGATYAGSPTDDQSAEAILDRIAWYGENSGGETHPVGRLEPNPLGLFDMLGNVWEWCEGADSEHAEPMTDPIPVHQGARRVIRGGAWRAGARFVRAACRDAGLPSFTDAVLGFRLARGQLPALEPAGEPGGRARRGTSWGRPPGPASPPRWLNAIAAADDGLREATAAEQAARLAASQRRRMDPQGTGLAVPSGVPVGTTIRRSIDVVTSRPLGAPADVQGSVSRLTVTEVDGTTWVRVTRIEGVVPEHCLSGWQDVTPERI